ncbi:hypothetical protein [Streptomyces sp. NPDC049879]|uniref:putative alpha/beta hydrolase n=1 Tax=Streptomyces sp. NPDC049879 TaxID=3365598 RepID=UPI00378F0580
MIDLSFTVHDVVARAGVDPWQARADFVEKIDTEQIADLAAQYTRSGEEANGADEMSRRASEHAAEAGEADGSPLADGEERSGETARNLQDGGEEMYDVAYWIRRSADGAVRAVDAVKWVIDEPQNGLDAIVRAHEADATSAWQKLEQQRTDAVAEQEKKRESRRQTITLSAGGHLVKLEPRHYSTGTVYPHLNQSAADGIVEQQIAALARAARAAYTRIKEVIDAYHAELARYAGELGKRGYDLDGGSFKLFTDPGMAEFLGRKLHEELSSGSADPNIVKLYTEGLAAILGGIVDGNGVPGARLTGDQRDYLSTLLGALTMSDLAALGRFEPGTGLGNSSAAGVQNAVMARVADAINLLMDPGAGGYDVSDKNGMSHVPSGVRSMLEVARHTDGLHPLVDYLPGWDAFGKLMSHASVVPGDSWGRYVAENALDVQQAVMNQYLRSIVHNVEPSTGSSDLLGMVARNGGLSADLLNDADFFDRLAETRWTDATGAGKLLTSGTTIPPGMSANSPAAKEYIDAAYHVLTYSADHPDFMLGRSDRFTDEQFDHTALRAALGGVMGDYMDAISQVGTENRLGSDDRDLFGKNFAYSFDIDMSTRNTLFALMRAGDETTWGNFVDETTQWAHRRAAESFGRTEGELTETADFEYIGSVMGSLANTEAFHGAQDFAKPQYTAERSIAAALGTAATALRYGTPAGVATNVVVFGIGQVAHHMLSDEKKDLFSEQWDVNEFGRSPMLITLADAVVESDFRGAGTSVPTDRRENLHMEHGLENAKHAAVNIGGRYAEPYFRAAERAFDRASQYESLKD